MKLTRLESFQRDRGIYRKRVRFTSKASIGNIGVFSLTETGKEQYMCWRERPTLSLYPNAIGKTLSLTCQTYLYDCMRTNIGRAVPWRTLGIVIAIICNIDKWFNINYFHVCCQIMKIDTLILNFEFFLTNQLSALKRCIGIMYSGTCNLLSFMWHCIINFCMNLKVFGFFKLKFDDYFYTITSPLVKKIACLSVISGGFIFREKKCRNHFFYPFYCKILHLKAKRNFTLLVASSADFVSAIVILNQHLDVSLRHKWNLTLG